VRAAADEATAHADQVARGERFEFGDNWRRFLEVLDDERIAEAERSLREMLGVTTLEGRRFLDIGSGSGLFSLAARRLGAERVHSFDFDPSSVACTRELRRRYFDGDPRWTIEEGSVLDEEFVSALGRWDVVYSWGVLHHTGAMWRAIELAQTRVDEGGRLFISIYNDQGERSVIWRGVKRIYNSLPAGLRQPFTALVMGPRILLGFGKALALGRPLSYVRQWTEYKRSRGMSRWHDIVDWIGGYPFEVAKPEEIFRFLHERGFQLEQLQTCAGGNGCNQYVFSRSGQPG
jgi:2-polyprenyl-6-hydroxyphenyl methylase/3-demethylubiquinone-9 3-methyltransferase